MEGWANVKKAANYAGVSERTLRFWLKKGLKYVKLPTGTILIQYNAIDEYLKKFEVTQSKIDEIVNNLLKDEK